MESATSCWGNNTGLGNTGLEYGTLDQMRVYVTHPTLLNSLRIHTQQPISADMLHSQSRDVSKDDINQYVVQSLHIEMLIGLQMVWNIYL